MFYVLLTVHPCNILQLNPTKCTILLSIFISLLYMFRATVCPSSGEIAVSTRMRHWYLSLCMGGICSPGWSFTPTSRPDVTQTEWKIPVSHRYSNLSWWWAYGCPKHVEKRNKYAKLNCAPSWIYLQDDIFSTTLNVKKEVHQRCMFTSLNTIQNRKNLRMSSSSRNARSTEHTLTALSNYGTLNNAHWSLRGPGIDRAGHEEERVSLTRCFS